MTDPDTPARAYARIRYRLLVVDLVAWFVFLAAVQWLGISHGFAAWWAHRTPHEPLIILGYLAFFGVCQYLVMLPLHVYSSFLLEHRFGLSRLTLAGWLTREAKRLAVSAVIGALLVEGFYAILRHVPNGWPLWATIGWVGCSVVLARIFPTVLLPIFYKTTPLQDEQLAARLGELCQRAGIAVLGVFRPRDRPPPVPPHHEAAHHQRDRLMGRLHPDPSRGAVVARAAWPHAALGHRGLPDAGALALAARPHRAAAPKQPFPNV
ncbi:MAG: hypothetical protein HYW10_01090 [Candidatus Omnitrophica bacterium]|nr:hypothetical protein [Candidatus Omnitrophota bacterium]